MSLEVLKELHQLMEQGVISEAEFETKKAEILAGVAAAEIAQAEAAAAGPAPIAPAEYPPTQAKSAMIMAIFSVFCLGIFLAIPAFIVASSAKKITDAHPGHPDAGSVTAARVVSGIVMGLSVVVLAVYIVLFGAAAVFYTAASDMEYVPEEEAPVSMEISPVEATEIYELGRFESSLSYGASVLVMEIAVEGSPYAIGSVQAREHQVRDAILLLASDYTPSELESLDGKLRLREDIHRRINAILAPHQVDRIYFIDFRLD